MRGSRFSVAHLLAPRALLNVLLAAQLLTLPRLASAAVQFVSPIAGAALVAGGTLEIAWVDDGLPPTIADLTTYKLFLCAGGNTGGSFVQVATITTTGQFANGNRAQGVVSNTVGGDLKNAYFLQMVSDAVAGGTLTSYSTRFSLTGMKGAFSDIQIAGITALGVSTAGPQGVNSVAGAHPPGVDNIDAAMFALPWAQQTGPTRYAAMQPIPPSKITKNKPTPLNPTSSFNIATTFLPPPPPAQTTFTQSQTQTFTQSENPVAPAAMPDAMQRFLNRWRD